MIIEAIAGLELKTLENEVQKGIHTCQSCYRIKTIENINIL